MLNFERLTARNKDGLAYLVNVKPDEQEVDSPHKNTLKCILDCFERLAQYEEAEIARQSVKSEEVAEAISWAQGMEILYEEKQMPECADRAKTAITALQAYQPWIPVSERLPESGMPVLITYIGFHDGKPYLDGVATWHYEENGYSGGWVWEIDGCEVAVEITHWKPLPEPPKGE